MEEILIDVTSLEKSYGNNQILKGISLQVKKGQVYGILGVNGAGKTTLLEIMEGLRSYQKGNVLILNKNIDDIKKKSKLYKEIGVQLQLASIPEQMTVKEITKIVYAENKVPFDKYYLDRFGIDQHRNKKYSELSTGLKRRLHLALALVNNPELIILDEPTAGLDLQGRANLHAEILRLKEQGKTIILSSHDSGEIEKLCDAIGIIKDGKFESFESIEEFKLRTSDKNNLERTIYFCTAETILAEEAIDYFADYKIRVYEKKIMIQGDSMVNILSSILTFCRSKNLELTLISSEDESFEEKLQNSLREDRNGRIY